MNLGNGLEIDLMIDTGKKIIPVEIKAAETFNDAHFKKTRRGSKCHQQCCETLQFLNEESIT